LNAEDNQKVRWIDVHHHARWNEASSTLLPWFCFLLYDSTRNPKPQRIM